MADAITKLNDEKILSVFKEWNVPCRLNDLKNPSSEFIIRVFECFLKDLQIDIHNPVLKPWSAVSHIEHKEMHEDAQYLILLAISVNRCLEHTGIHISIKDITDPKPKRTKKILNFLLVFWNFYLEKRKRYVDVQSHYQEIGKIIEEVKKEKDYYKENIETCIATLNNSKQTMEELVHLVTKSDEKIKEYNMKKVELSAEYQALKKQENDLIIQTKNTEVDILSCKEKINELDQLILSSPEKFSSDIQRIKNQIKDANSALLQKQTELKDKKDSIDCVTSLQTYNVKDLEFLHDTKKSVDELSDLVKEIVEIKKKCDEGEEFGRNLESNLERKGESKDFLKQKAALAQIKALQRKENFIENLSKLERQVEDEKECILMYKKSKDELKKHAENVVDEIVTIGNNCKAIDEDMLKKKEDTEAQVDLIVKTFIQDVEDVKVMFKEMLANTMK